MLTRVASATTFFLQELSMKRSGFTMIELIFVIVILGILAAVAIPKLAATRDDAKTAKLASDGATFMSDVGAFYTSKGSFFVVGSTTVGVPISDVTNVAFGTTSAPVPATTAITTTTPALTITDGTNICATFSMTTAQAADGNITVTPTTNGNTGICKGVRDSMVKSNILGGTTAAPAAKTISFGASSVVQ